MANVATLRVPECARCNALCCRVSIIPLNPHYAWDRAIIDSGQSSLRDIDGIPTPIIARQASGSCIHLDDATNRCRIYARRPHVCRTWGCLSREDALRLGMTAVEQGINPLASPPLKWLKRMVPNAWKAVRRYWDKR